MTAHGGIATGREPRTGGWALAAAVAGGLAVWALPGAAAAEIAAFKRAPAAPEAAPEATPEAAPEMAAPSGETASPLMRLRTAIVDEAAAARPGIAAFYAERGGAPLWIGDEGGLSDHGGALLAALGATASHALAGDFGAGRLAASVEKARTLPERAAAEIALAEAYLAYARAVGFGQLDPRRIDRDFDFDRPTAEAKALLERAAEAPDGEAAMAAAPPQDPLYGALRDLLRQYRGIVARGGWPAPVPDGPTIKPGHAGPRVAALRERLTALGDFDPDAPAPEPEAAETLAEGTEIAANDVVTDVPLGEPAPRDPNRYGAALQAAVARFQARHGLNEDGLVGPATLAALNTPAESRLRQIAVGLERLRWLNRDLGHEHIIVNLADFRVSLMEGDRVLFSERTVIGKAWRHETPEFSDEMEYLVVNPTWHVPYSIASEEILPKLKEDPTYLSSRNMRLEGTDLPADLIDWEAVTPASFPGRIKQGPGSNNALGRVKFMFPNRHSIYLHDTPQKSLFSRDVRAFSHGCIRVRNAYDFAHLLLERHVDGVEDGRARFEDWYSQGTERYVHFSRHLPVHLTYRTAWIGEDGRHEFRQDIYGRDHKVADALIAAGVDLPEG